jgi:hypothetical protein
VSGGAGFSLHISNYLLALAFAAYFVLYFFNAMAPEASPDGSTYHLGLVARYLREHGFQPITWNIYASLSEGVDMLVALAWQMVLYARRAGFPIRGGCAALLVFARRWWAKTPPACITTLLQAWDEELTNNLLTPIGLLAGFAYAIKYTGGVGILYAIGFVAWKCGRGREVRPALIVGCGAGVRTLAGEELVVGS